MNYELWILDFEFGIRLLSFTRLLCLSLSVMNLSLAPEEVHGDHGGIARRTQNNF